ncbi:MAG: hypothetical protein A2381_04150 [Bdellovibrionales bacterium RIFOXYB1_FULL_37_110]|nr:MAG: hypothetical protein A2417_03415 [Bdellovibrionales bacterium RIFOXYC1_FULL_37_79]OFZ57383.1 MAG: hypothetical protein A2381_04150 [Bdellovibrionales bacterium RIFOXYB1_FULL_37_110]OFZ63802.1 MAG: hypothetical protein A2577_01140 [Bdellovibrionales bacterium RIFOXYD1_FULL_36_51]
MILCALKRCFLYFSIIFFISTFDLFASETVGIVWQMHDANYFRIDAETAVSRYNEMGIKIEDTIKPDNGLDYFQHQLNKQLGIIKEAHSPEIYIDLKSHGWIGSVGIPDHKKIPHTDIIKKLIVSINKFAEETGKKISVNLTCDMCHAKSWETAFVDMTLNPDMKLNPLVTFNSITAAGREEFGYAKQMEAQIERAKKHLERMGNKAKNFCTQCTPYQKILKLINEFQYSDITMPSGWTTKPELLSFSLDELLISLESSTEFEFDKIYQKVQAFIKEQRGEAEAKLVETLKRIKEISDAKTSIRADWELAVLEKNHKRLFEITSARNSALLTPAIYPSEDTIANGEEFKNLAANKSRIKTKKEDLKNKIRLAQKIAFQNDPKSFYLISPTNLNVHILAGETMNILKKLAGTPDQEIFLIFLTKVVEGSDDLDAIKILQDELVPLRNFPIIIQGKQTTIGAYASQMMTVLQLKATNLDEKSALEGDSVKSAKKADTLPISLCLRDIANRSFPKKIPIQGP